MNNLAYINIGSDSSSTNNEQLISLKEYKEYTYYKCLIFGKDSRRKKISLLDSTYLEGFIDGVNDRTTLSIKEMYILNDDVLKAINRVGDQVEKNKVESKDDFESLRKEAKEGLVELNNKISDVKNTVNDVDKRLAVIETVNSLKAINERTRTDRIINGVIVFISIVLVFLITKYC